LAHSSIIIIIITSSSSSSSSSSYLVNFAPHAEVKGRERDAAGSAI